MLKVNTNPSRKELAWFGVVMLAFFGIIGAIVWWKFEATLIAQIIWGAAGALTLVYYAVPPVRQAMYLGLMYAVHPIGWTISHILLGLIYYLVATPIGLIMRACGKDPMQRKLEPDAESYWIARETQPEAERYFRQF